MAQGASRQMRDEMGPEFDDIDWRKLDPRQYDPRRIVREALSDSLDPDDPLGLRGAGVDRRGLGLDPESLGLDEEGVKPVSSGGPGARRPRPAPPRQAGEPGTSTAAVSNGTSAASPTPAAAPALDDVPLDPDAT